MKTAISCQQSDMGLCLCLCYLGQKTKSIPLFPTSFGLFSFPGNESSQSTSIYGAPTGLQSLGGDVGCWTKPRMVLTRQLKEMSILGPGPNRAVKNQLPLWVGLFWTSHSLLAEAALLSERPKWVDQPCSCTFLENYKHNADNLDGWGGWLAESLFSPQLPKGWQQSKSVKQMLSDVHHFLLCKCKCV